MIVCAKCNQALRPIDNAASFIELAGDRPYKLWAADLLECQGCGAQMLRTGDNQQPIAEHFELSFEDTLKTWNPKFTAKEWTRAS